MTDQPNYYGVTMQHVANLRNHAEFVRKQPKISMCHYATDADGWRVAPNKVHACSAAMCAIGLVPLNKGLGVVVSDLGLTIMWGDVSERAFGFCRFSLLPLRDLWDQTFGPHLPNEPNTIADGMLRAADTLEQKIKDSDLEGAT